MTQSGSNWHGQLATSPPQGRVSQQAYDYIRSRILGGEYSEGTVLPETEVAETLGVSRTPVRHALRSLLQEGLVVIGPRRQIVVSGVPPDRRREIFLVRETLERVAVTEACRVMALEEIDELRLVLMRQRRAAEANAVEDFVNLTEEFHLRIAVGAKLSLVARFLEQLWAFVRVMGIKTVIKGRGPVRMQEVLDEHNAIVDALEARDPEAASSAMAHHLAIAHEGFSRAATGSSETPEG